MARQIAPPSSESGRATLRARIFDPRFLIPLFLALLLVLLCAGLWLTRAPHLDPEDYLLLTPDSLVKVEAAAMAGDLSAQSALGAAYLRGGYPVAKNVMKAVYWFERIASRDEREFRAICARMQSIRDQRTVPMTRPGAKRLDLEYLHLVDQKLSFELAFSALFQICSGGEGPTYANPTLALKYLRQGAEYGFPSAQRRLGVAYVFGLLGLPKNRSAGLRLLTEAANHGDHRAEYLLGTLYESGVAVPRNVEAAKYWFGRAVAYLPDAPARLKQLSG